MSETLNGNQFIRVVRGETPERLVERIQAIYAPTKILGFGQDEKGAYCYLRTDSKHWVKRIDNDLRRSEGTPD